MYRVLVVIYTTALVAIYVYRVNACRLYVFSLCDVCSVVAICTHENHSACRYICIQRLPLYYIYTYSLFDDECATARVAICTSACRYILYTGLVAIYTKKQQRLSLICIVALYVCSALHVLHV